MTIPPDEKKQYFQEGWKHPDVVAHRIERFIDGEFGFEPSRTAWRDVLRTATASISVRQALDMGTGPGTIAQFWAEFGFETTGLDFSSEMLAAARETVSRRGLSMNTVEGDVEAPPFPQESFDLVSSRAVLFTLPHPGYAVARWTSLLRPGGLLVLIGENSPTDAMKLQRQNRPPKNWKPSERYRQAFGELPFRSHTDGMIRVVMEAAGLEDIRSLPMQAVIDAREEHEASNPPYGVLQGTPYVLVGQRA